MSFEINDEGPIDGFTVARVTGEIDLSNAADFIEELVEEVDGASAGLIADISGLSYMDSSGVRALFDLIRRLELRRQVVGLVVPETCAVRTLVKVTHLHEAIPVCESAEECSTALRLSMGGKW